MRISKLTDHFSTSPQIQYEHVKTLAKQGYTTIINHRPDGEDSSQPLSKALAKAARQAGVDYFHIPFKPGRATQADKIKFKQVINQANGPVLAFCRSGIRAKALYKECNKKARTGIFSKLFQR